MVVERGYRELIGMGERVRGGGNRSERASELGREGREREREREREERERERETCFLLQTPTLLYPGPRVA